MKYNLIQVYVSIFILILCFINQNSTTSAPKKSLGKEKDPLAGYSDADLEKMMKSYGVNSKDLGILGSSFNKEDKTLSEISDEDDPLKSILDKNKKLNEFKSNNEIYEQNKKILKMFNLNEKEAFNFVLFSKRFDVFTKLPVTGMNVIEVIMNVIIYLRTQAGTHRF